MDRIRGKGHRALMELLNHYHDIADAIYAPPGTSKKHTGVEKRHIILTVNSPGTKLQPTLSTSTTSSHHTYEDKVVSTSLPPGWLGTLLADRGVSAGHCELCEEKLARQEGFTTALSFARTPGTLLSRAYLSSLGITALGLQQVLIDLHLDLNNLCKQASHRESHQRGGVLPAATHQAPQRSKVDNTTFDILDVLSASVGIETGKDITT